MGEATDKRAEFMALIKAIDEQRAQLAKLTGQLSQCAANLMGHADQLLEAEADEKSEERRPTVRRIVHTPTGRVDGTKTNITVRVGDEVRKVVVPKLAPGKRGCSNCRQPGHRAKNCTEPPRVKRRRKS